MYEIYIHVAILMILTQYESFWVDPTSVSFLWISILYSALYLGSQINQISGKEPIVDDPEGPAFFTRAGQALVTGKYHKARAYSVEAVLLYGICKYQQKEDPDTDAWMIMGISARVAMRMGYHRDPRHLASISPFEGEMRRRTFLIIESFDLLLSFQAGLPTLIHEEDCDFEPPSNLFDTDFDEESNELPPSRPPIDETPMLYYCTKNRIGKAFRRIFRHALSPKLPAYEETMKLDAELHETHALIPPSLRMRPLCSSFTDETYLILNRLNVDLMYLKSLCILHRNYLSHDRSNPKFNYSRKTCADAALQTLKHQADFYAACQPGGQFYNDKWMVSSLMSHDFLLAAMITSLDLYESHNESSITSPEDLKAQIIKYDALTLSREIWTSRRAFSRDARRAANVLAVMLSKVPRPNISSAPLSAPQDTSGVSQASRSRGAIESAAHSSGSSSWDITEFDIPSQGFPEYGDDTVPELNTVNPLYTIFGETNDIDWVILVIPASLDISN